MANETYISDKVATHLTAALPLAVEIPLSLAHALGSLLLTLVKGLVEQETCPKLIKTLWQFLGHGLLPRRGLVFSLLCEGARVAT